MHIDDGGERTRVPFHPIRMHPKTISHKLNADFHFFLCVVISKIGRVESADHGPRETAARAEAGGDLRSPSSAGPVRWHRRRLIVEEPEDDDGYGETDYAQHDQDGDEQSA